MSDVRAIGIIGAGTMGRGIAQDAAAAGLAVTLFDTRPNAAAEAKAFVEGMLGRLVEKGRLAAEAAKQAVGNIAIAGSEADLAGCDLVVEAVVEDLAVKRDLMRGLEAVVAPTAILASNTSSLPITAIAAACRHPQRVVGMHFFNPVPLMKLVEVVAGLRTEPRVVEQVAALAERMGKRPVRTRDTPGFVVNHVGRGYGPEALRILAEGIAPPPVIDRIMRAAGFRMGPFELFDLVGLDISKAVMEQVYRDYYEEPAYRPSAIASARVAAGLLGRKTGEGFYRYGDGAAPEPEPANAPLRTPIWVHPSVPEAEAIRSALRQAGAELEDGAKASDAATCLIAPLGADAAGSAVAAGLDPRRVVAVDLLFGAARPLAAMRTLMTEPGRAEWVAELLGKAEPLPVINDSPGFVAQRIVAMIVNVASNVAQQRIAAPADIDLAVKLGLGYPHGPLEWADAIGPSRVLQVLDGLYDFYRDPAYRAAPWLRRRALLGVSMLTPD